MKNIISFSGGKDSTALVLWAFDNLKEFDTVFCDTGWEHQITYDYIEYINKTLLDNKLIVVKSEKYDGFVDMTIKKKCMPSTMSRFCTEELKLKPMKNYIKDFEDVHMYLGIRRDESHKRSKLAMDFYDSEYYNCWLHRPIIEWTAMDCFNLMKKHNIEPNPLYKMGMKRVGCMPCIMSTKGQMKTIFEKFPDVEQKLIDLESHGHSFFPPSYIPERFCSQTHINKKGIPVKYPIISDVKSYLTSEKTENLFEEEGESCMSYYSICE